MAPPLIDCRNIEKLYTRSAVPVHALRGVSVSMARGEYVALLGASGSGKSTLMHILGFLDRPSQGEQFFDGFDVSKLSANQLADHRNTRIGFVFQNFNLLPRSTVVENVELPLQCRRQGMQRREFRSRALACLERVGLRDRAGHYPNELSGGQQQRVAIARALVNAPDVILADEPTGNLDSVTSGEILNEFRRLNSEGVTLILVTHTREIADQASRQITLLDGKIVTDCRRGLISHRN
jgi:putative ABC transport system ATP-binding protein